MVCEEKHDFSLDIACFCAKIVKHDKIWGQLFALASPTPNCVGLEPPCPPYVGLRRGAIQMHGDGARGAS